MESNRELRNCNFQWTKTLYQNNLNNTAFFFTFFKGYRCNKLSVITPKSQISQNDVLHMKFSQFYLCFHNSSEI